MIYREWFNLRYKVLVWLLIYGGSASLFLIDHVWSTPWVTRIYIQNQNDQIIYQSLFNEWLSNLGAITPFLALLGSLDLFSEERGKGTLTFLLPHPVNRTRIFAAKLLLTAGCLAGIAGLTSLLVLAGDRIPKPVYNSQFTLTLCEPFDSCLVPATSQPIELSSGLTGLLLILLCGVLVVLGTGLCSVFCHSIVVTGLVALPVMFLAYAILYGGGRLAVYQDGTILGVVTGQIFSPWVIIADYSLLISWVAVLLAGCMTIFVTGLVIFKYKNF